MTSLRTSLGGVSPQQIERLKRGNVAEVARELVEKAGKAGDAQAVAKVLGELELLAAQYKKNDAGASSSAASGVSQSSTLSPTHGQRSIAMSPMAAVKMSATSAATASSKPSHEGASLMLAQLYARFPSLTVDLEPSRLAVAAEKALGGARAGQLVRLLANDKPAFMAARAAALDTPMPTNAPPKRAVVSGLSNGGMVAVALLAKSGFQVDAFEMRSGYTRNIQYGGRQALLDQLTSIDPKLCDQFLERVGKHVGKGSVHTLNETRRTHEMPAPQHGDAANVPESGEKMLAQASTVLMECKEFEKLMSEYIEKLPNVTIHNNASVTLDGPDDKKRFSATNAATGESLGTPDLVVVSEGGNSSTFRALGVKSAATSPAERYIAGVVHEGSGGVMAKHFRDVEGKDGPERVLIASMGNACADKTWIVAGVADGVAFDPPGLDPKSPEYLAAQREMIETEFRHSAALVMEKSPEELAGVKVEGPMEKTAPTLFTLQQRIAERAVVGDNVVGFGDVVGNNHFSVGGGMQVAAIAHGQRLKKLIFDMELNGDFGRSKALGEYNKGALEDTMAWGRRGIADFYPYVSWQDAGKAYTIAIQQWREGHVKDPLEALEKILGKKPHVKPASANPKKTAA